MSVANHFDHTNDAGFIRTYDTQTARRQFQVSVVLIIVLAMAAFALGLLVRFDESTASSIAPPSPAKASELHFAGKLPQSQM
jgi:hypothetical protein